MQLKYGPWAIWFSLLVCVASGAQSPNASVQQMLRAGETALDAGDYARAAGIFERARQTAPENLAANRGLVLSYLQMGRMRETIQLGVQAGRAWPQLAVRT